MPRKPRTARSHLVEIVLAIVAVGAICLFLTGGPSGVSDWFGQTLATP